MRITNRLLGSLVVVTLCLCCLSEPSEARRARRKGIEKPVRGQQHRLDKVHGPWMIMVATFSPVEEENRTAGMSPQEAADELVYELRMKGLPAYVVTQDVLREKMLSPDERSRNNRRQNHRTRDGGVAVLAGNFESSDSRSAQKRVAAVKKFHPKFLRAVDKKLERPGLSINKVITKTGGIYRKTVGRPGPLSGAHLTINPLLSAEEARRKQMGPLLLKLNSNAEYSLLENNGRLTVVVASFYGKSVTLQNEDDARTAEGQEISGSLDTAARNAWELAQTMRSRSLEAYVWHDQHRSLVTVGSFGSPNDPRVLQTVKDFGAKMRRHPGTGQHVLTAETMTIPAQIGPGVPAQRNWIFDPQPRLMEIPRLSID